MTNSRVIRFQHSQDRSFNQISQTGLSEMEPADVKAFVAEIQEKVHSFRVRRMKSNRVLAKRMGEWVEEAVETNRRMSSQHQLEQMGGGDLPMPGEREVDENDGAYGEEEGVGGVSKEGDDNCAVM